MKITIAQAIERTDRLCPNKLEAEDKSRCLSDLDMQLVQDCHSFFEELLDSGFTGYSGEADPDTPLLVEDPYTDIYRWRLEMLIHDRNQEYGKYNNAVVKFQEAKAAYYDWVNRTYTRSGENRMYYG